MQCDNNYDWENKACSSFIGAINFPQYNALNNVNPMTLVGKKKAINHTKVKVADCKQNIIQSSALPLNSWQIVGERRTKWMTTYLFS